MKKLMIAILTGAFILGAGTFAFAQTDGVDGKWSFQNMLPLMQKMHPDFSNDELEQMYNDCHGSNGQAGPMAPTQQTMDQMKEDSIKGSVL
ncbi:hypothetical protein [Bacillus sp. B15-48]|uniref:hypothetical protein n=1 Tax=Bacillus sp. B15-48 TaxID=1548601 RepID=UPI00193EDF7F|nr:hypothetical protein [Bacillus sp. B15-48]